MDGSQGRNAHMHARDRVRQLVEVVDEGQRAERWACLMIVVSPALGDLDRKEEECRELHGKQDEEAKSRLRKAFIGSLQEHESQNCGIIQTGIDPHPRGPEWNAVIKARVELTRLADMIALDKEIELV